MMDKFEDVKKILDPYRSPVSVYVATDAAADDGYWGLDLDKAARLICQLFGQPPSFREEKQVKCANCFSMHHVEGGTGTGLLAELNKNICVCKSVKARGNAHSVLVVDPLAERECGAYTRREIANGIRE